MNMHTPARQPSGSQGDYRNRRHRSQRAAERMTLSGAFTAPGRKQPNSREQSRKGRSFANRVRYADGLMAHWAAKRSQIKR